MEYRVEKVDAVAKKDVILQLWRQNFPEMDGESRFEWMYEKNPEGVPEVWLLLSPGVAYVGMVAVCKRIFFKATEEMTAGQTMDFVVNEDHRSLGPAIQLQRRVVEEFKKGKADFLYSFPNKKSKNVIKRAGFVECGLLQRWTLVLCPSYVVQKYFKNKRFASIVGKLCDILFKIKHVTLSRQKKYQMQPSWELNEVGSELDEIWNNFVQSVNIVGKRDAHFLQWRFGACSSSPGRCFIMKEQNVPRGYIIFQQNGQHISIVDYMSDQLEYLEPLFRLFVKSMMKNNYMSISIECNNTPFGSTFLQSVGFVSRPSNDGVYVVLGERRVNNPMLKPDTLFVTIADRDI